MWKFGQIVLFVSRHTFFMNRPHFTVPIPECPWLVIFCVKDLDRVPHCSIFILCVNKLDDVFALLFHFASIFIFLKNNPISFILIFLIILALIKLFFQEFIRLPDKKYRIKNHFQESHTNLKDLINQKTSEHSSKIFFGGVWQSRNCYNSENKPHFDRDRTKEHDLLVEIAHTIKSQKGRDCRSGAYLRYYDAIMRLKELHKEASWDGAAEIEHPKEPVSMRVYYLSSKSGHD